MQHSRWARSLSKKGFPQSSSSNRNPGSSILGGEMIPPGTTINISILGVGSYNSGILSNNVAALIRNTYSTPLPIQLTEEQKARSELLLRESHRFPLEETSARVV